MLESMTRTMSWTILSFWTLFTIVKYHLIDAGNGVNYFNVVDRIEGLVYKTYNTGIAEDCTLRYISCNIRKY